MHTRPERQSGVPDQRDKCAFAPDMESDAFDKPLQAIKCGLR